MSTRIFTPILSKNILALLFAAMAIPLSAQIQKGAKTLQPSKIDFSLRSSDGSANDSSFYNLGATTVFVSLYSPKYMVSNRLQLGVGVEATSLKYVNKLARKEPVAVGAKDSFTISTGGINWKNLVIVPQATYFFTKNNRGFYLSANIRYLFGDDANAFYNSVPTLRLSGAGTLGYILPINENIYWNVGLSYSNSSLNEAWTLGADLTNFVQQVFPKNTNEDAAYIRKGRLILDAQAKVTTTTRTYDGYSYWEGNLNLQRLVFLNNQLAFGGYLNAATGRQSFNFLATGAKARYYIPISKRWYVYPDLNLGVSATWSWYGNFSLINLDFDKSVGFSYFITPNIAFNTNISLNFQREANGYNADNRASSRSIATLGLTYFVDKLFGK
jgi:hypothetical protein